jgi:hypothetical protein
MMAIFKRRFNAPTDEEGRIFPAYSGAAPGNLALLTPYFENEQELAPCRGLAHAIKIAMAFWMMILALALVTTAIDGSLSLRLGPLLPRRRNTCYRRLARLTQTIFNPLDSANFVWRPRTVGV